ncbi:helix-turn-helix domain-containing protein [Agrobacterium vitis]|uniref:helix-turn-helix domain-containing protein n=1 Tax=Agrobacterium vitis TaxID=373 RepID=UPI0008DC147F|nr:helix-turn-helix transcriptional regulator [Agrobacterium vitis]MUO96618.1 helix-turn-helix domain-containing protein [Agrobacterium vitis]MVA93149.1 helix-turn-helix domain-containing protein [Agrobacterium vitis]MVB04004.1 helix-turn-helix domain-containing protein [Agrobacterium vitis]
MQFALAGGGPLDGLISSAMSEPYKIREWRRAMRMKQVDLAARAGKSPQAISAIENGGRARLATMQAIAGALGITLEELSKRPPRDPQMPPEVIEDVARAGRIMVAIARIAANDCQEIPPLIAAFEKIGGRSRTR